jgi:hypothetical protein
MNGGIDPDDRFDMTTFPEPSERRAQERLYRESQRNEESDLIRIKHLNELEERPAGRGKMPELNLDGLFTDGGEEEAEEARIRAGSPPGREPYRGQLVSLFSRRKVILDELRVRIKELGEVDKQIEQRATALGPKGGRGDLIGWALKKRWTRLLATHGALLKRLLGWLGEAHCADNWECAHRDGMLCDDVCAEKQNLATLGAAERVRTE